MKLNLHITFEFSSIPLADALITTGFFVLIASLNFFFIIIPSLQIKLVTPTAFLLKSASHFNGSVENDQKTDDTVTVNENNSNLDQTPADGVQ